MVLAVVEQVVIEHAAPIHWEAVLITAIPATLAFLGSVVAALVARKNHSHLQAIDQAVNGVEPGAPTVREKVEAIAAKTEGATELAEQIAAGTHPEQPAGP